MTPENIDANHQVLTAPLTGNGKARRAVDLVYRYQPGVGEPRPAGKLRGGNIRLSDGNKKIVAVHQGVSGPGALPSGTKPGPDPARPT